MGIQTTFSRGSSENILAFIMIFEHIPSSSDNSAIIDTSYETLDNISGKLTNSLLSILHLNCRSLNNKTTDLATFLHFCSPDIIGMTETWLDNERLNRLYFKITTSFSRTVKREEAEVLVSSSTLNYLIRLLTTITQLHLLSF